MPRARAPPAFAFAPSCPACNEGWPEHSLPPTRVTLFSRQARLAMNRARIRIRIRALAFRAVLSALPPTRITLLSLQARLEMTRGPAHPRHHLTFHVTGVRR
ncbi:hypothetical protein GCM10012319_68210 [Comamonas sp. KCTC 72670]|nr:hypothetical protein GCM10012319_68210 [Comamonas sp. KCTC 72670]